MSKFYIEKLIFIILFATFTYKVKAQSTLCPNVFKCGDTLVDARDGKKYKTVQIGTQCWFGQNLDAITYLNGDSITNITDDNTWLNLTTEAYCYFNNDAATYEKAYGALYNWWATNDIRGICPKGWYVPTNAEYNILFNFLGGINLAGGPMKDTGTTYWDNPNNGGTNSSGWTGRAGGVRYGIQGTFAALGWSSDWWTSTVTSPTSAWAISLHNDWVNSGMYNFGPYRQDGFCVRCMKDN